MRIESVDLTFSGSIHIGKRWLDCELGFFLLPWEWEVFRRKESGRIEACFGPFYIDVYWGIKRDLGELEEQVLAVAGSIDADPEEIEQDIVDAIRVIRCCKD